MNRTWTQEEDDILKQNYPIMGAKKMIGLINRSSYAIQHRAMLLNIKMNGLDKNKLNLKYTKDEIIKAIENAKCYADAIRNLSLLPRAGNYITIKHYIKLFNIDISHFLSNFELAGRYNIKPKVFFRRFPIEEYLRINSNIDTKSLKEKLYKSGLKKRECELCGQDENWRGKKFSLILDHINGIHNDNRLENLQIVCPNCNATLDTHCSKNRKTVKLLPKQNNNNFDNVPIHSRPPLKTLLSLLEIKSYFDIAKQYNVTEKTIKSWINESSKKNIDPDYRRKVKIRPSVETLLELINTKSYREVGKTFNVTDNCIKKWFKDYGIEPPKKQSKIKKQKKERIRKVIDRPSLEELCELIKIMSYAEIGRKYGIYGSSVRKWFKYYGVQPPKKRSLK